MHKKRKKERKERSTVLVLLSEQLKQILDFISIRYYYCVTGNTASSVSATDLMEIFEDIDLYFDESKFSSFITKVPVDDLHLYKVESISDDRIDLDAYTVTVSTFDLLFRVPAQKQIEKFIIMYQRIIPDNLYTLLIDLTKELSASMYFEDWSAKNKKVSIFLLKHRLKMIAGTIAMLRQYLDEIKRNSSLSKEEELKQRIIIKWANIRLRGRIRRLRKRKHITKDNDTSTNV